MNEITQFRCILPPTRTSAGAASSPGSNTSPGELIRHSLHPLRDALNAALARDDRSGALTLAYTALTRIADTLAAYRGDTLRPKQVRVHALLVELETLPLEPLPDGTVVEHGTAVTVNYQSCAVDRGVAEMWAKTLTERFRSLWPGAWVVVGTNE
jgi:hypothetical protein